LERKEQDLLLTYRELMALCKLSKRKTYELLHDPSMPVVVIGKQRFMNAERFRAWIEQHTQKSTEA